MSIIASNLKLLREEASLTIEELSEKTGINISLIEGFENNKYVPNEYQLEILCKILKMPADEIGESFVVDGKEYKTADVILHPYKKAICQIVLHDIINICF